LLAIQPNKEDTVKSSTKNNIEGKLENIKGKVEEKIGKLKKIVKK